MPPGFHQIPFSHKPNTPGCCKPGVFLFGGWRENAAQFDFDVRKMVEDLRRLEKETGRKFVSFPPKPPRKKRTMPAA
jgi:hypothetical protein